jgi:histidinol-phosphate aminotransferase
MIDYVKLAGEKISSLEAYKPGKPIDELKREFGIEHIVKLASNENPLGPSPKVAQAIELAMPEIMRYPLGDAYNIRMLVAEKFGVAPNELVFGSGSNEVIELLLRTFVHNGELVASPSPSFSVYGIISTAMGSGCKWSSVNEDFTPDLDKVLASICPKTRVLFIANPNNPTGAYINETELRNFVKRVPEDVIIVMDEAYVEFADAPDIADTSLWYKEFPNVVVMRTFSKAYGLAGLRMGYAIANATCCDMMNRVRQPFNTNMLAQAAACAALQDDEWLAKVKEINSTEKQRLYRAFEAMGLSYVPSQANFILVKVGDGERVFNGLLRKGVIARFMGKGLAEYIRVSIGKPEENEIFINALKEVL